jgi:hypothetical protein
VNSNQHPASRATRFAMNLPVRYRARGDEDWSYGMTVNISCSGVLFRTARAVAAATPVEIELVLPGDREASASVISRGSVIRTVSPGAGPHDRALAVALDEYDFVRTSRTAMDQASSGR